MAFKKHNFKDGEVLYASHLNEIENELEKINDKIENQNPNTQIQSDYAQNDPTKPDYIQGRTHWVEPPEVSINWDIPKVFDTIAWDGDTSNRPYALIESDSMEADERMFFYKVSDNFIPFDDFINCLGCATLVAEGEGAESGYGILTEEIINEMTLYEDTDSKITEFFISSSVAQTFTFNIDEDEFRVTIPEPGVYFFKYDDGEGISQYISELQGRITFTRNDADIYLVKNIDMGLHLCIHKVSDTIPDKNKLLGLKMAMVQTNYAEGEFYENTGEINTSILSDNMVFFEDGTFFLLADDIPYFVCIANDGSSYDYNGLSLYFEKSGTYFMYAESDNRERQMYIKYLGFDEIVHKLDPKFVDLTGINLKVESSVSSNSDNAVSGRAVYNHTSQLFSRVNTLESSISGFDYRINSATSDISGLHTLMNTAHNKINNSIDVLEEEVGKFSAPDLDVNSESSPGYVKGRKFYRYLIGSDIYMKTFNKSGSVITATQNPTETAIASTETVYLKRISTFNYTLSPECFIGAYFQVRVHLSGQWSIWNLIEITRDRIVPISDYSFGISRVDSTPYKKDLSIVYTGVANENVQILGTEGRLFNITVATPGLYFVLYERSWDDWKHHTYSLTNVQGIKKLDSLFLNLEKDISTQSFNAPTTEAVYKAVNSAVDKAVSDAHSDTEKAISDFSQTVYNKDSVYNKEEVDSKISKIYRYCGTVDYYTQLPTEGNEIGDAYNVVNAYPLAGIKDGDNVAWDGEKWDVLAGTVDLSAYAKNSDVEKVSQNIANVSQSVEQVSKEVQEVNKSKIDSSKLGNAEGVATLDSEGHIPEEQIPPSMKEEVMIEGYYNKTSSLFYEDVEFIKPIQGKKKKFYLDITETVLYIFNGSVFVPLAGGFREEDYLTDEEYEEIMGGMGL